MIKMEVDERDVANDIVKRQESNSNVTSHTIDTKIKVEENEDIKVEFMESEESNILSFEHNCRMIKAETDERDDANDIVKRHETNSNFAGHTIDMKIKEENEDIKVEPKYFEIDDLVKREDILIPKECSSFIENLSKIIRTQVEKKEEGEENPISSITGLLEKQEQEEENNIDIKYETLDYGTERPIENAECDFKNKYKDNLKQHIMSSHEKENSSQKLELKEHMAMYTEMVKTCILCEASFEHKYQLDAHYVSAHPDQMNQFKHLLTSKVYECFHCLYAAVYLTDFKNHLLMHEDDSMKFHEKVVGVKRTKPTYIQKNRLSFVCKECDKTFTRQHNLDSHILVQHKENKHLVRTIRSKVHRCPECSYQSIHLTYFKSHLLTHEKGEDKFKYKCNVCDYKSLSSNSFIIHSRLHTGELPYKCTECHKKFNAKKELDSHILFRHKDNEQLIETITNKIHQCPKCSFETISITNLKSHLLTHEKSDDTSSLRKSSRRHQGQLPYMCTECKKTFNKKQQLNGHILSRHKENEQLRKLITNKVHQCPKCSYRTINITYFKKHLARHEEDSN